MPFDALPVSILDPHIPNLRTDGSGPDTSTLAGILADEQWHGAWDALPASEAERLEDMLAAIVGEDGAWAEAQPERATVPAWQFVGGLLCHPLTEAPCEPQADADSIAAAAEQAAADAASEAEIDAQIAAWRAEREATPQLEPEVAARMSNVTPFPRDAAAQARIDALPPGQRSFADIARATRPQRTASLTLLTPADCAASQPRGYVVKGLIAPRDLVLMVAKPGGGKSALAPAIGYAVAQGRTVFGRRTKAGTVLYIPCEDPHGMRQRVHALKLTHGDAPDFLTVAGVSDLFSPDSPDPDGLHDLAAQMRPALIVIDTLAAAWRGIDENEGADMARVIKTSRHLADEGCAVMLLCHPAKAGPNDGIARGHGSLNGDADVSIALDWLPDGSAISVRLTKNRNGPAYGEGMAFTIKGVRIGTDEDGDAIFAPVAHETDATAAPAKGKPTADAVALGILTALIASQGQPLPADEGYPAGAAGVPEEVWRCECDAQRLSTAEKLGSRDRAFRRAFESLRFARKVGTRDGLVWLLPEGIP